MGDWPVGLSTGCFYRRSFFDVIASIRDAGFAIVEICSFPAHLDYHDVEACERAAARLRELHLEPYSFHAPFAETIDITSPDRVQRERSEAEIGRAAEAAARLGVRYFVIHPGPERADVPRHERLDRMENAARSLNALAARARSLGLRLVLENMLPHLFAGPVRDLMWLLGSLDTTEVGICLDTGHAQLAGDLPTVAHKLSGHLWMIHASDTRGRFDDHLPPGEGAIAWRPLLRQLAASGFRGALVLEVAGEGDPAGLLRRAAAARTLLRDLSVEDRGRVLR